MKKVKDVLHRSRVWVNPGHLVASAVLLMRGHDEGGLPVLDGPEVVGLLQSRHLLGVDGRVMVESVMDRAVATISSDASVREAAEVMSREGREHLVVVGGDGTLAGVLSRSDLVPELRRSLDPLTELPWSDVLREWAVQQLEAGQEITLVFFDVDDFGRFNKRFGHVVGDAVLRTIADRLREAEDSATDVVCRYGGDEFCLGTVRAREEADELAERIRRELAAVRIPEARGQGIQVSTGIRGGRRTREREKVHFAATLNNLINLASQDCIRNKAEAREHGRAGDANLPDGAEGGGERETAGADTPHGRPSCRLELARLEVGRNGDSTLVTVELRRGQGVGVEAAAEAGLRPALAFTGAAARQVGSERVVELVAEATVAALRRALPVGHDVELDEVVRTRTAGGSALITVVGRIGASAALRSVVGTAVAGGDMNRAAAAAVLAATNRSFELLGRDAAAGARQEAVAR